MKKLSKGTKIGIIIGAVVAGLVIGYVVYAYVVSNVINECIDQNNFCRGIFPFETHYDCSPSDCPVLKPIIYLYPEEKKEVTVRLGNPERLSVSYPKYTDGWNVVAEPNGKLTDKKSGRELYSLYWEGKEANYEMTDEGFVVARDQVASFLEEKLSILGLNEREVEEFIIYWLPKMQEDEYNYVRFSSAEEIDNYMPLEVSPKPDTVIRINMILKGLDKPVSVQEQKLGSAPKRTGFTVVEWGGSPLSK